MNKLYSFDIFDTLITRTVAEPKGIFLLMQESMQNFPSLFRSQFLKIRSSVESYVRKYSDKDEILFDDIYEFIEKNWGLTSEQAQFIKELEIKMEYENSIAIEHNIFKIKKLLLNNEKVILISDMYLPQNIIRSLLCKHDSIFQNITIYMSSDYQKRKYTGELFKFIKEKEEVTFDIWVHFGDNKISDFKVPKKLGINANLYTFEKLKPYEKKFIKNDIISQLVIGTARNLRLLKCNGNKKMEMGCSFAAPIIYSYVSWILETAITMNIRHLFFVMRDGFILKQVADILIAKKNIQIKTHYIYGSKFVWKDLNNTKIIIDYFKQEINFSKNFAFVDAYGSGETHIFINKMMKENNLPQIKQFYFESSNILWKNNLVLNFMPTNNYYAFLLEPLLRSLEGQLIGYENKNGKIIPILNVVECKNFFSYGYQNYIDGVLIFSEYVSSIDINLMCSSLCFEYLKYINKTPDRELAKLIGSIPFDNNTEFAPSISFFGLIKICLEANGVPLLYIRMSRSGIMIRWMFNLIRFIRRKLIERKRCV